MNILINLRLFSQIYFITMFLRVKIFTGHIFDVIRIDKRAEESFVNERSSEPVRLKGFVPTPHNTPVIMGKGTRIVR